MPAISGSSVTSGVTGNDNSLDYKNLFPAPPAMLVPGRKTINLIVNFTFPSQSTCVQYLYQTMKMFLMPEVPLSLYWPAGLGYVKEMTNNVVLAPNTQIPDNL